MGATIRSDVGARLAPAADKFFLAPGPASPYPRVVHRDFELDWGTRSDHPRIHRLLIATFQEPSLTEFLALNDAPRYDPSDRLLMRRDAEIAAHVHLVKRTIHFGGQQLVAMDIKHLATLPEYRSRGLARRLHDAALDEMRRAGVYLATVSARHPAFFAGMGWFPCGRYSYSEIRPSDFLASRSDEEAPRIRIGQAIPRPWTVQVWRRNELDSLVTLYDQACQGSYGLIERLESDWRWLVARAAFDYIYVVRDTAVGASSAAGEAPVVGYAIVRDARILELVAKNNDSGIQTALMTRVCRDALECGRGSVAVHAAPDHPLHHLIRQAGGAHCLEYRDNGRVVMAKITRPLELLGTMRPILKARAQHHRLTSPMTLNIDFGEESISVALGSRTVSVAGGKKSEHGVKLSATALGQMLMGHRSAADLLDDGEISATSSLARATVTALFPAVPMWRPAFDDEPA